MDKGLGVERIGGESHDNGKENKWYGERNPAQILLVKVMFIETL